MLTAQRTLLRQGVALLDALTLTAAFALAYLVVGRLFGREFNGLIRYLWLLGVILPVWITGLALSGLYRSISYRSGLDLIARLAEVQVMAGMALLSLLFLTKSEEISRLLVWTFFVTGFVALLVQKFCLKAYFEATLRFAPDRYRRVVLVGSPGDEEGYLGMLRRHVSMLTEVVGMVTPAPVLAGGAATVIGTVEDFLGGSHGDLVVDDVVAVSRLERPMLGALAQWCASRGTVLRIMIDLPWAEGVWRAEELEEGGFMLSLATVPEQPARLAIKRLIDIAGALVGLVLCGVALAWYGRRLRKESGASALFAQERVGCNGRRFTLYKFRTMYRDSETRLTGLRERNQMNGPMFKLKDDPRVTPTGRKLRRSHLDELPQFWNVLRGDMSLVGTRPPTLAEVAAYEHRHHRRLSMKPGITGIWQLNGNGKVNDFDDVVKLDCEYIDHWSLGLDARILARTVVKVLRHDAW